MIPSASAGPNTVRNPKDPNGFTLTIRKWFDGKNGLMATPADSRVRRLTRTETQKQLPPDYIDDTWEL